MSLLQKLSSLRTYPLKLMPQSAWISLLLVSLACALFIQYADRPLAVFVYNHFHHTHETFFSTNLAEFLTQIVYCFVAISILFCCWLTWRQVKTKWLNCLWLINQAVVFAYFIKMTLQFFFGRYTPRYADSATLLFVRKPTLYGFHWFQEGSFPSGHMSVCLAAMVMLALHYPLYWPLTALLSFALAVILLLTNYHFASDLLAGAFLGTAVAYALYKLSQQPSQANPG